MERIERVRATLAGRPVDRAPFSVWYHFGNQHAPAELAATRFFLAPGCSLPTFADAPLIRVACAAAAA